MAIDFDTVIAGGTVISPTESRRLDVCIRDGRIAALVPAGEATAAAQVIDATDCLVVPGGVDTHVHYALHKDLGRPARNAVPDADGRLPNAFSHTEGPEYSYAAAMGGTTTVIDFAYHEPGRTIKDSIALRRALFDGRMAVDYSMHITMTRDFDHDDVAQVGGMIADGFPTFKTFMTYATQANDGQRYGLMKEVARHGGMSLVHAEDDAIARWINEEYVRAGKTYGAYVSEVRNAFVEEAGVRRALFIAEEARSSLLILHMASGRAVRALAAAQSRGLPFHGETLIAYLSFTQDNLWEETPVEDEGQYFGQRGLLYNNYPTLKTSDDRAALWDAITSRDLATIATDHSAGSFEDRYNVMGSSLDGLVQAGQSAAELRMPLAYHLGVNGHGLSVNRWIELVSTNPAKISGLWPRKGELLVGSDADVVVFDPARRWTVDWRDLHNSARYSLWDGQEMVGAVRSTLLQGKTVVSDGRWVGDREGGQFIQRQIPAQLVGSGYDPTFTRLAV